MTSLLLQFCVVYRGFSVGTGTQTAAGCLCLMLRSLNMRRDTVVIIVSSPSELQDESAPDQISYLSLSEVGFSLAGPFHSEVGNTARAS